MKVTYFNPSYESLVVRLYLMMTIVIATFCLGAPYLAVFAVPIFISSMLGLKITYKPSKETITKTLETKANYKKDLRA